MLDFLANWSSETASIFHEASLYILLGFGIAGLLHEFLPSDLIARHLGREGPRSVLTAALFGAPIPLCSCGVLPAAAALRRKGAGRSPTMAFLVSTPETGVDSVALTYGLLGGVMAVVRPAVAVLTAVVAGVITWLWPGRDETDEEVLRAPDLEEEAADECADECAADPSSRATRVLRYGFVTLLDELAFWLVIGIALTGVLAAALPADFFSSVLGLDRGIVPMLWVILAGVPLYLCASASTPVAAALIAKGLSPGAALVFLLVGPATNAATLTVVARLLGRRRLLIYLGSIIGVSLAAGLILDAVAADAVRTAATHGHDDPAWLALVKGLCAVALLGLLFWSGLRTRFGEGIGDLSQQGRQLGEWLRWSGRSGARWLVWALALAIGGLALHGAMNELPAASGSAEDGSGAGTSERPLVMVSVLPQKFLVDRLAGDFVRVAVMIPPGANPASHEPTMRQMREVSEASLYIKVGHPAFAFERAWLDRMLAESPDLAVLDVSVGLDLAAGDPHIWLAPEYFDAMARRVEAALAETVPERRRALAANLEALQEDISRLDAELRERLAGVAGRPFFVFHPAWGYFARAYGLEQVAIEHDHKEPDVRELAALIERARAERVKAVFVQPQFDPAAARTVAAEVGARLVAIDPLAYEWDQNLRDVGGVLAEALAE